MPLEYFLFGVAAFLMTGVQTEVTEVLAEAGSQAVLPCKCSSLSATASTIMWSKEHKGTVWRKTRSGLQYWGSSWLSKGHQRARCPHSNFERDDYSLLINNVRKDDGGTYTCRVGDGFQVTEIVVTLRIIKVIMSPSVPVSEQDVLIDCSVTPWPRGATVQWSLNNRPFVPGLFSNGVDRTFQEKATLRLTGNWTCVVEYAGKEGRASATLAVKGIIQPPKDNTKLYAAVGSAATLPCVFSPGLIPSNTKWEKLKPGSLPASFSRPSPSAQPAADASASLAEVGFEDKGVYRCSGDAEGQRLTRNMQLVVARVDISVPSKTTRSTTLTCQLTDESEVTDYEWFKVVHDLNGTQSVEFIHKGKTLRISRASEDEGERTCCFYGKDGILGNVTYGVQLMSGLSGQKPSGVSNETGVVVCLSLLLIALLLVLVKVIKNYQRRKRIFQFPALETIVHTISNEREERERSREKK